MGLTVKQPRRMSASGRQMSVNLEITPTGSWPGAGEPLDLTTYVPIIETVTINTLDASGYVWKYDRTTKKILAFQSIDPADAGGANIPLVPASGDLTDQFLRVEVTGTRA